MKNLLSLVTAIALLVSVGPAFGATTVNKSVTIVKGGPCNGYVVRVNTKTKTYVVAGKSTSVKTKTTTVMCESAAKAKGYRMMTRSTTVTTKKHTMTTAPVVNPSGILNADKGASPNPMNNANGVHTTKAPNPTPTP
ncbi:MAG: hypothetical protein NVS1B14_03080 [Vulcanimicrobiaceae bacterium]